MVRSSWQWACIVVAASTIAGCAGKQPSTKKPTVQTSGMLPPADLKCEYRLDPLGVDSPRPRLGWIPQAAPGSRSQWQSAYQIIVASNPRDLSAENGDLWDSGKVQSDQQNQIEYEGKPLTSRADCFWKVRIWDRAGTPTAWSAPAKWSMGLLSADDWKAKWIGLDEPENPKQPGVFVGAQWIWYPEGDPAKSVPVGTRFFRRIFTLPDDAKPKAITCWITGDNEFSLLVNGNQVGTGSDFHQAYDYDLTDKIHPGTNALAIRVKNTGEAPNPAGVILKLEIELKSGAKQAIFSDKSWQSATAMDGQWVAAKELGAPGIAPWGEIGQTDFSRLSARMLRKEIDAPKKIQSATVYFCGLGLSELYINGKKIGDAVLSPALSEYNKRAFYVTYDVTDQLKQGKNAIGVWLGNGRYFAPRKVVPTNTLTYGYPKLLLQMHITYDDGGSADIVSDESWKLTTNGPIRANNEYDGEEYDARLEMPGWSAPGFDESKWQTPRLVKGPGGELSAQSIEPIKVVQTIKPIAITNPRPGIYIYDMGQNMVGWCSLKVSGPAGMEVALRHAETLGPDGMLYLDNIRSAKVRDVYTLKGSGVETYEPRFTYHGFRFVELRGFPGTPKLDSIEGRVVNDAMDRAGEFACSNELLNQIYHNIFWGVRGNYRSIPTDCPQRDERQGWLGDRSAESQGESYLFDIAAFYNNWLLDINDAQKPSGSVPDVAPSYWPLYNDGVTWPSSFIIIPGHIYDQYGDTRILADRYAGMKKWIDHMVKSYMKDDLMPRDTYGDWCVPPESQKLIHSNDPARRTDGALIGTAYFIHDLRLMAQYAKILGKADDAREFESLAGRMRDAFNKKFFHPDTNTYANGSQTSSVLPLALNLVPQDRRTQVFQKLIEKIEVQNKGHIGTGLIGAQWLMRVLSDHGRIDVAYEIASQKDYPSWGYMISKGATTIWELWNGDTADPAMNSGNHVMLVGDLAIWMHEYLAGIAPDPQQPGFEHIIIRPRPVGDLKWARATFKSIRGTISSDWKIDGNTFTLRITVPANTLATVYVPTKDASSVKEGGVPAVSAPKVWFVRSERGSAVYEVGSGGYVFTSTMYQTN